MARFIQSFYIFAIDNLFLGIIRLKLEMDMRDIFSANAADFSVPMRNSLLFPACRAYAMPVAKSPFEVFRKASISAAKQLRLSNKGNKIHFFCIPHLRHAATRWLRLSYIPGTVPRMSMLYPQVSGAFCTPMANR